MSDCTYTAERRVFLVLLASGVAISAWALFPRTVERGIYVPLPEMSTPSASDLKSTIEGVDGRPVNDYRLINAKLLSSKPTVYGVSPKPTMYGLVTARYPSPVVVVSLRSKLQALLMLLYSQSGDVDPAALEAKLQALLKLPDSVLAGLMEHPDLADLNRTLDAVFLGTSDLSGVKTELDKIEVTSVPAPSEQIDVVEVNGKPAYIVHSPVVQNGPESATGSPVSALPPPGEAVTVTVISPAEAPAALSASTLTVAPGSAPPPPAPAALSAPAFTVAPSSEQLTPSPPPAPAALSAPALTAAPSSEPLSPPPASATLSAPALTVAPSSEQFTSAPAPAPMPTSTPTAELTNSQEEPTGTPRKSADVLNSGNRFEPGDTVTDRTADNSPATNSPATQSETPSTPATDGESPADASGVTGGGGVTSPSNNHSTSPSNNHSTSPRNNHSTSPSNNHSTSPSNNHSTSPSNNHSTSPSNNHRTSSSDNDSGGASSGGGTSP